MQTRLSPEQEDRLVFAPDAFGSGWFLVSGVLAYRVATGPRLLHPARRDRSWKEFDGARHQLPIDDVEEQDAIHGLVRWAAWTAGEREPHRVVMEHLLHPRPGNPFSLALAIEYRLSEEGLGVTTTATNAGRVSCPFGSGAHPYLTLGSGILDDLILRVPGGRVLRPTTAGSPSVRQQVEGTDVDFRRPRTIGATKLDNAFTDLERDDDGLARVQLRDSHGANELILWVDERYPYLMVFTGDPLPDVDRRALAVEPMTCPPNAFRTGTDLVRLEPGQSFTGRWGVRPGQRG